MKVEETAAVLYALMVEKEKGYVAVDAGITVITHKGRSLAAILLHFEGPLLITNQAFESVRRYVRAAPCKRSRFHRWQPRAWQSDRIGVHLCYRDGHDDETIRLEIYLKRPHEQPLCYVEGVAISRADRFWFDWKAAYQRNGYFVIAPGLLLKRSDEEGDWHPRFDETPYFVLTEIDFSEIASWEKIQQETELARKRAARLE